MSKGIYSKAQEHVKDYWPRCCAIRDRELVFIGMEYEGDGEGVCVTFYSPNIENVWGAKCEGRYYRSRCCIVPSENNAFVLVGWNGDVIAQHGFKQNGRPNLEIEVNIPILSNCPIMRIRHIAGQAYVAASWRTVFRREGIDKWTCLSGNDPKQVEQWQKDRADLGFNDIGGFAENDIYACGGQADLQYFDGEHWQQLDCPTNFELTSLCCAPNGKVYIGCEKGVLIEGRAEKWKVIDAKAPDIDISDMVWYQDQLYLACGMYGLYVFNGETIQPAPGLSTLGSMVTGQNDLSDDTKRVLADAGADKDMAELADTLSLNNDVLAPASVHTLSTDGEILLVAGTDKVVAFDGEKWKVLFAPYGIDMGGEL